MNEVTALPLQSLDAVWQLLEHIPDPEIPVVSIRELGILRDVRRNAQGGLEIVITPTYSGCPAIGQMEDDIHAALDNANLPARIVTQLAPAWTTDWMTASAHQKLREYGIAPPQHLIGHDSAHIDNTNSTNVIRFASRLAANTRVPCPRCASSNTTETSHFASTACKALYKCLDCLEPFDYFKPY